MYVRGIETLGSMNSKTFRAAPKKVGFRAIKVDSMNIVDETQKYFTISNTGIPYYMPHHFHPTKAHIIIQAGVHIHAGKIIIGEDNIPQDKAAFVAWGTKEEPIVFSSHSKLLWWDKSLADKKWDGITVSRHTDQCIFRLHHCIIEHASRGLSLKPNQ